MIQRFLKVSRKYFKYWRYAVLYAAIVFLAKHTAFFETGFTPQNFVSGLIVAALIIYRFVVFAVLPGVIFYKFLMRGSSHAKSQRV